MAQYTVNYYDPVGGATCPASQTTDASGNITLTNEKPTREYYIFNNWNTKSDGTGSTYRSNTAYTLTGNLNLFAIWAKEFGALYFNANGGSGVPEHTPLVEALSAVKIPDTEPTKEGYTFLGWATSSANAAAGKVRYRPGDAYPMTHGTNVLYAVWLDENWERIEVYRRKA